MIVCDGWLLTRRGMGLKLRIFGARRTRSRGQLDRPTLSHRLGNPVVGRETPRTAWRAGIWAVKGLTSQASLSRILSTVFKLSFARGTPDK